MLSSGRGLGGVVVRGIEPDNPVVRDQWGRYMIAGSLADLREATHSGGRRGASGYHRRPRDRRHAGKEAQGQDRRRGSDGRADYFARRIALDQERAIRHRRDLRFGDELHRYQHGLHGSDERAGFLWPRRQSRWCRYPPRQPRPDRRRHRRSAQAVSGSISRPQLDRVQRFCRCRLCTAQACLCAGAGDADRSRRVQPRRDVDHGGDGEAQGYRGADRDGCDATRRAPYFHA